MTTQECIIGLDISTAITGYAILDADTGALIEIGHIDTLKDDSLWETADTIRHKISKLALNRKYRALYIEESLSRFRKGFSSAHTLSTLAKINGVTSYMARIAFNCEPQYIKAIDGRTACGVKVRRAQNAQEKKDVRFVKQQIFDQMTASYTDVATLSWPLTRPSKQNPSGRLHMFCYDMMDAYVIAMAGFKGCKTYEI